MNILIKNIKPDALAYFDSCARIRNITTTRLFARLAEVIAKDQLVLSILDDNSGVARQRGEQGYRARRESA